MKRSGLLVLAPALAILLGLAAWMRLSSLGSLPEVDGDEAWHAIQLVHMLRGEPFSVRTEHGLPLSAFHAALELPLLLAFEPSYWLLRVPTAITGLLAVWLTFVVVARMFDRATATIAAILLAVLPVAIVFSRTGYESSHAPLYGLVMVYCAYRGRVASLAGLLACCYFVHPTNIFLLPVLLAAMAFGTLRAGRWPTRAECHRLAWRMAAPTAVVLVVGLVTLVRPMTGKLSAILHLGVRGPHDWSTFWTDFARLPFGWGRVPRPGAVRLFWMVMAALFLPGLAISLRRRRYDVLALVAGVILSALTLFVVGSSGIIQPGITRYGLFLIWPLILATACMVRALLVAPAGGWRASALYVQQAGLVAVAAGLLWSCDLRRIRGQVLDGPPRREQSIWTFGDDAIDPRSAALQSVAKRLDREAVTSHPTVLIVPDFMTRRSLQYLALSRRDLKVVEFTAIGQGDMLAKRVDRQIRDGAFLVMPPGHALEPAVKWLLSPHPHEAIPIRSGRSTAFILYRARPADRVAAADTRPAGPAIR